jgi:hypothetical protein
MCLAIALDRAFEKIDCMNAILRRQAKNRLYESTQRLIQLCRDDGIKNMHYCVQPDDLNFRSVDEVKPWT